LRTARYLLLGALCLALLAALVLAVLGSADGPTWTLTPTGWLLLDGLLCGLVLAALPTLVTRASAIVSLGVSAALCLAALVLVVQPPFAVNRLSVVLCALGAATIFIARALGPRGFSGARKRWTRVVVPALVVAGSLLLAAPVSTFPWTTKQVSSPGGKWVLALSVRDWGALDSDSSDSIVWLCRDAGLLRQRRILSKISGAVPAVRWQDASTVVIDAKAIDIGPNTAKSAGAILRQ
jgi:hypothetical protein